MTGQNLEQLVAQIRDLSDALAATEPASLAAARARKIRKSITEAYEKLRRVIEQLDPIKHPGFVFDPSNPEIAGKIAAIAMLAQERKPLANIDRFYGSGVYALYYRGDYPAYSAISRHEHPIYVGKADPANPSGKTAFEQGDKLAGRLNEHRRNIAKAVTTLRLDDFDYRALVVQSGWQTAAEEYLIHMFKPIWNMEIGVCYGFGKHGDDPNTRANLRSPWDTLHPGREWAHRAPSMRDARASNRIISDIEAHFARNPPFRSIDSILLKFMEEMRSAL